MRWRSCVLRRGGERAIVSVAIAVAVTFLAASVRSSARAAEPTFLRGDANADGAVTLSDVFAIFRHLHLGFPVVCEDAVDVDDSGRLDLVDPLYLIGSVFFRSGLIPAPSAEAGTDPTPDGLTCGQRSAANLEQDGLLAGDGGGGGLPRSGPCGDQDIGVADLEFVRLLREVKVMPGQTASVPILLTTAGPTEGFTLSLSVSPEHVTMRSVSITDSVFDELGVEPGLFLPYDRQASDGLFAFSAGIGLQPPFEPLPSFYNGVVGRLLFDVSPDAPVGEEIILSFADVPAADGFPALVNELSRDGTAQPFRACPMTIRVVSGDELFVRGDSNRDWRIDLADVVTILNGLFVGGGKDSIAALSEVFECPDAADVNDDSAVDVSDALFLAGHLFRSGAAPESPFPYPGEDSGISDELACVDGATSP